MNKLHNHGKVWTETDCKVMATYVRSAEPLRDVCLRMGRTGNSVTEQLRRMRVLYYDALQDAYLTRDGAMFATRREVDAVNEFMASNEPAGPLPKLGAPVVSPESLTTQEQTMSADNSKAVDNVTYVYGKDARTLSDDDIFRHIGDLEQQIKALCGIEAESKKLDAKIESLRADILALVNIVDNR